MEICIRKNINKGFLYVTQNWNLIQVICSSRNSHQHQHCGGIPQPQQTRFTADVSWAAVGSHHIWICTGETLSPGLIFDVHICCKYIMIIVHLCSQSLLIWWERLVLKTIFLVAGLEKVPLLLLVCLPSLHTIQDLPVSTTTTEPLHCTLLTAGHSPYIAQTSSTQ